MKKEQLYEVIGDINESYVNEAHGTAKKKSRAVWTKWVAIAASLALVVGLGVRFLQGSGNQPYTATLSNGNEITFIKGEHGVSNLDIALVGMRALSDAETNAVFGNVAVDANVGFEEGTNEFVYLEGTIDGFDITVMRSDISPDTVIDGEESASDIDGVAVLAGYFLTKANSQGNKTAIVYASFEVGNYTIYLETSGAEAENEDLCNALADEIQKLIDTASFDFSQIK